MRDIGAIGLGLILLNFACSYKGFSDPQFFERYKFEVDSILLHKEYGRLLSSGFLHGGWMHLIFNMLSLHAFSGLMEYDLGWRAFLLIYVAGLLGGNLLSLYLHRQHGDYSAIGASGAVCGVVFASIALFPGMEIGFFGLPFQMPSWLFGTGYVAYCIFGIKANRDNIGHDAHLGGALVGMVLAVLLHPSALKANYLTLLVIALPTVAFLGLIIAKPHLLLIERPFAKAEQRADTTVDRRFNEAKLQHQHELDLLLDKISHNGIESLSATERQKLEAYAKRGE
ncbi:Membrane associated serine protease, rhomboid family [Catalinimonas alkaloidigena]|uniref:Membrane associated serine protease, rhomboid family n=1 Tax=Catalinimonas alkaloidigena TaxID=1075417 RepID=A0A1G9DX93_9BACT|nr:rhomboid family intramembrane serine protease [Catalinimonas alkaloidigena]SDK68495.1 Membrane associated serine protease, rhomboid family [Catalinimonas alkaloidigena]